jgi:hypothetical protein
MQISKDDLSVIKMIQAGHQWLEPVILATWEAEIRRIAVPGSAQANRFPFPK